MHPKSELIDAGHLPNRLNLPPRDASNLAAERFPLAAEVDNVGSGKEADEALLVLFGRDSQGRFGVTRVGEKERP
jgi:hypothetical protein